MWRRFGRYSVRSKPGSSANTQGELFAAVEKRLRNEVRLPNRRWRRHTDFHYLQPLIDEAEQRAIYAAQHSEPQALAAARLEATVLRAPGAVLAQIHMDKHKHSYRNRAARVLELIDFNDAYVSTVLATPSGHLHTFNDELKRLIDWFCKRVGAWTFSDEQFEAITHGLSREIAVYNAAKTAGFTPVMTTRTEDALGIDMHITDQATGRRIHVDTKTNSAFHYRLIDLLREGRLTQADIELAEQRGFTAVMNGHSEERVRVMLWRIDQATLGTIQDFAFERADMLIAELTAILREYGE